MTTQTRTTWMAVAVMTAATGLSLVAGALAAEAWLRTSWAAEVFRSAQEKPPHPFLQVTAAHEVDDVNEHGLRGGPIAGERASRSLRVITLGGSTTLGVDTDRVDTYPYRLEQILRERLPGVAVDVQNAGVAWHATPHLLVHYELKLRQLQPDVVVVFEAINDLYRSFSPLWWARGPYQPDYSHYLGPLIRFTGPASEATHERERNDWLLARSLQRWWSGAAVPYSSRPEDVARLRGRLQAIEVDHFRSLDSYRDYYGRLLTTLARDGVPVIVGSQAFLYREDLTELERARLHFAEIFCAEDGRYPSPGSMEAGMRAFNDAARALSAEAGALFVDLEATVPKTLTYFTDDVHLTRAGNERIAQAVADVLTEPEVVSRMLRGRAR